jgi:hypothetical protein
MKWITRTHVHVDRVACPWLISRFIDSRAEFVFIPWPGDLHDKDVGTPFDFPDLDIPFTHHDGKCTFEVLIGHYNLQDPVLSEMANIIHGADIKADFNRIPESSGIELALSGLAYVSRNDHQAIQRGFILCDSIYAGLLLRTLKQEMKKELEGMSREETFHLLQTELKRRLPETIEVG